MCLIPNRNNQYHPKRFTSPRPQQERLAEPLLETESTRCNLFLSDLNEGVRANVHCVASNLISQNQHRAQRLFPSAGSPSVVLFVPLGLFTLVSCQGAPTPFPICTHLYHCWSLQVAKVEANEEEEKNPLNYVVWNSLIVCKSCNYQCLFPALPHPPGHY